MDERRTGVALTLGEAHAPGDRYGDASRPQPGVPAGMVTRGTMTDSHVYPGTRRSYWIYVPAQCEPGAPAAVMVFQDGEAYVDPNGWFRVPVVFDNLIHAGDMPVTVGIFVNAGQHGSRPAEAWHLADNRSLEYDTLSDTYARFVVEELLPIAERDIELTDDPEYRAIAGFSSGGICAFTVAWERPDMFRKVVSHCGSFAAIRGGHEYPFRVRQTARRPLRVFLQSGAADVNNEMGHWQLCNQQMAAALEFRGYDMMTAWGEGGHDGLDGGAMLPDTLRWLWRE